MATQENGPSADPETAPRIVASGPSRRALILGALTAAGASAAAATTLVPMQAGAAPGDPVTVDNTTTGGGGTTTLASTTFKAAVEDWGGQVFNVKAYGATGSGSTDDTPAITAAQSAAGAGCVYFPPGTYRVTGLVVGTNGQTLKLESGATLLAAPSISGPVVKVTADGVSILGPGTIDGNSSMQTGTNGLDCVQCVAGADDPTIQGLVVQNAAWIGIEADGVNRARIVLNRVLSCAQAGISCINGGSVEGPIVLANEVLLSGSGTFTGINVQGTNSTLLVMHPVVTDNQVTVTAGIAYQIANCAYGRIASNYGTGPVQVFSVVGGTDNSVTGNTAWATGTGVGIEIGTAHATCIGNIINQTGTGPGIHADNPSGSNVIISNNKITGAKGAGINVGSYDHVSILGNVITQSTGASASYAVIQIAPGGPGMIVIADNICDASGGSIYGIWLENLVSSALQISIHDNTIAGIPSIPMAAAVRLAGAGTITDLLVHDNAVGPDTQLYTTTPGISFGNNVQFHHNIVVGGTSPGVSLINVLPASGTPYTNPGPFTEIVYLQGGVLTGTGTSQGVTKNGLVLAPADAKLATALAVILSPNESLTVYYSTAPTAHKDVRW